MREVLAALEAQGIVFLPHQLICLVCPEFSSLPRKTLVCVMHVPRLVFPVKRLDSFLATYLKQTAKERGFSDFCNMIVSVAHDTMFQLVLCKTVGLCRLCSSLYRLCSVVMSVLQWFSPGQFLRKRCVLTQSTLESFN